MISRTVSLFLISLMLYGCEQEVGRDELVEAVDRYYQAEKNKDWDSTYEMRTDDFRGLFEISYYKERMNKDYEGWGLKSYVIVGEKWSRGRVALDIEFTESPSRSYRDSHYIPSTVDSLSIVDKSVWVLEAGKWRSVSPGERYVLTLNGEM